MSLLLLLKPDRAIELEAEAIARRLGMGPKAPTSFTRCGRIRRPQTGAMSSSS